MQKNSAQIEITEPKLFTAGAVLTVSAYGFVLVTPIFASMLVVSLIKFGLLTVLIPSLVVMATAYFLPFGQGATHLARLVRSLHPGAGQGEDGFIVQLTLSPRLRKGLRAILEDADDIGYLSFSGTELRYEGDSVKLTVPFDRITAVAPQDIGLRGLFVYGRRIRVTIAGVPEAESLDFAERSALVLPTSRAISRRLCERLAATIRT